MDRPPSIYGRDPDLIARRKPLLRYFRRAGPGLVEVEREIPYRFRAFIVTLLAFYFGVVVLEGTTPRHVGQSVMRIVAFEQSLKPAYAEYEERRAQAEIRNEEKRREFGALADPLLSTGWAQSFEEYVERQRDIRRLGRDLFPFLVPIVLLLALLLCPRLPPLRVDGKAGVVYLWWRGRLYLALLGYESKGLPPLMNAQEQGAFAIGKQKPIFLKPLVLTLYAADGSGDTKTTWLGVCPPAGMEMWADIQRGIGDVIAHQGEDPPWLAAGEGKGFHWTDPLRWLCAATLIRPRRQNEEETYRQIARFLADHPPLKPGDKPWFDTVSYFIRFE